MKKFALAAPQRNVAIALIVIAATLLTNIQNLPSFPTRISSDNERRRQRQLAQDDFYLPRADVVTNACLNKIENLASASFNVLSRGAFVDCKTMEPYKANVSMSLATAFESNKSFKATKKPNVFILWIDSLSRAEFVAYLPKTTAYLKSLKYSGQATQPRTEPTSFAFLSNLVLGINTAFAFTTLFSGHTFRDRVKDSEWLQTEVTESAGYKFLFHDCYHLVVNGGFEKNYRGSVTKWKNSNMTSSYKTTCLGLNTVSRGYVTNMEYHHDYVCALPPRKAQQDRKHRWFRSHPFEDELILKKLSSFWQENEHSPKFAIATSEASHHPVKPQNSAFYDDTFEHMLKSLVKSKSTVVVVMTDHGQQTAPPSRHRTPFLNIIIPPGLLTTDQVENLAWNYDKLVTVRDLRHTLRTLTLGDGPLATHDSVGKGLQSARLPLNRTCKEAGVPVSMCPCIMWQPLNPVPEGVINATQTHFKKQLKGNKDCPQLEIQSATTTISTDYGTPAIKLELLTTLNRTFSAELKPGKKDGQYDIKSIHQSTQYNKDEACVPDGIRPEFCSCASM